jgi:hypothetical protein
MGLDGDDIKVLFLDDDVSLTQNYIERAFAADYDLCQGVITPWPQVLAGSKWLSIRCA